MTAHRLDVPPVPERGARPGAALDPGIATVPVRAAVPFDQAHRRITSAQTLPGQMWDALIPTDHARQVWPVPLRFDGGAA